MPSGPSQSRYVDLGDQPLHEDTATDSSRPVHTALQPQHLLIIRLKHSISLKVKSVHKKGICTVSCCILRSAYVFVS